SGDCFQSSSKEAKPVLDSSSAYPASIAEHHLRMHFTTLPAGESLGSLGLWVWGDVDQPSKDWPNGAIPMTKAKKDAYGYYLDVPLAATHRQQVSYIINNKAGENLSKDQHISLLTPKMTEVWTDENYHAPAS
ncbi:pullulanase-associated domain-containing protein, partial [Streptococcus pyogenes]